MEVRLKDGGHSKATIVRSRHVPQKTSNSRYDMIREGDRLLVGLSGGKD